MYNGLSEDCNLTLRPSGVWNELGRAVSPRAARYRDLETFTKPSQIASAITDELEHTTDLSLFDRKTVAYYTIATHACRSFDAFPILKLLGETNTGKNSVIWAIRRYGYRTRPPLVLRGTRLPILRDYLIETRGAVAIIDEADSMMDAVDFEELLKCRSRKEQGQLTLNRADKDGKTYKRESENIYGPLIVHRQVSFQSPSLTTRCIVIHMHSNIDRVYGKVSHKVTKVELDITLEPFELDGAPRIAENWCPVSSIANYLDDLDFLNELSNKLAEESAELIREAQASEPTRLVLDGALALSLRDGAWADRRWRLMELSTWVWDNHAIKLNPRQVGNTLRHHGLATAKSNGVYVANFQPRDLLKALDTAHATDDESYDNLAEMVRNKSTKSTRSTPRPAKLWPPVD